MRGLSARQFLADDSRARPRTRTNVPPVLIRRVLKLI
jgi:hypothetical protein